MHPTIIPTSSKYISMRMMHNIISINGMSIYIMGLNRKAKEDNYCSQFNSSLRMLNTLNFRGFEVFINPQSHFSIV